MPLTFDTTDKSKRAMFVAEYPSSRYMNPAAYAVYVADGNTMGPLTALVSTSSSVGEFIKSSVFVTLRA